MANIQTWGKMQITLIAGARPNFMKIAPLIKAIQKAHAAGQDIHYRLVHTGQHYDKNMSDTFFEELGIPMPGLWWRYTSRTNCQYHGGI